VNREDVVDYVLGDFSQQEMQALREHADMFSDRVLAHIDNDFH
jgi:peptidyl-tRNA hydrolase